MAEHNLDTIETKVQFFLFPINKQVAASAPQASNTQETRRYLMWLASVFNMKENI